MNSAKTGIYILQLTGDNYYVGKSDNIQERFKQHCSGYGAAWTNLHKPVSIVKVIMNADPFDEDKWVKRYMAEKGIDKVRGGSYSAITLENHQIQTLKHEIRSATDSCYKCGLVGHFAVSCYNTIRVIKPEPSACYRCGRLGHYASECYAKTTVVYSDDDSSDDSYDDDSYSDDSDESY